MTKEFPQRIHIIGSVGSGKTTLARELSKTLQIPYYELDNVAWIRKESGDIVRTDEEKEAHLQSILQTNSWIIEGIHQEEWVVDSFQQADCILFLDTPYKVRIFRIIKRFMKQKMGIEKAHYQPTFSIFFKMFRWNKRFEQKGKPRFFKQQSDLLNKILVIQQKKDLNNFLQQF
ncbi:AAA family ATPase [Lysinibacillus fusiformis]|uniref:AAA family ATPase n=1 Tax=Lysinibacillus sp. PWR01 TaxID=3342384 RepID=UPI00372D5BA3